MFSSRVQDLHASPIREALALAARPGMISFAGGLPAAESLPQWALEEVPRALLQYGSTEGEPALRARISDALRRLGLDCSPEQVLILSGSQQGIDLVAKLFVDPGTPVAVESPTYLAALQAFRFFGARWVPFAADRLEDRDLFRERPALVYVIPTFQNPTGHCYTAAERDALAQVCARQGVPVFEDDPYRDLVYETCDRTPVCARLRDTPWIYQGSFSKTLAPGLRLGFLAASPGLIPLLTRLKQAADLHSNRLSQWLVLRELEHRGWPARLAALVDRYRHQRDVFAGHLAEQCADLASWNTPAGGLFFWLTLKDPVDTSALLHAALARGVAFMPGAPFYPDATPRAATLRLNFSHATEPEVRRGLGLLARLMYEWVQEAQPVGRGREARAEPIG